MLVRPRLLIPCVLVLAAVVAACGSGTAPAAGGHIEIIEIGGNLDRAAIRFVAGRIDSAAAAGASMAIVRIDSRATLSDSVSHLIGRVADPPLPLVVWVGPSPATAFGGAARILAAAPIGAAAPGAEIGHFVPTVAGRAPDPGSTGFPSEYAHASVVVQTPIQGLVDIIAPSINNLLVELDGRTVVVRGREVTLDVVRETEGGAEAIETVFHEPGVGMRALRLATGVEAAFFFLMVGLAVAAFEFYALGPGIGAVVAALCLLIGGYGLAVLPVRPWAVAAALVGIWLLTADFQRGGGGRLTWAGAATMTVGGLFLTDAAPQIVPSRWIVPLIVISITAFYLVGMRTVARARFSTPTIGREGLLGREGVAVTGFHPDGVVDVAGARWKATAHREARIVAGDRVVVGGLDGPILEVTPQEGAEQGQKPVAGR